MFCHCFEFLGKPGNENFVAFICKEGLDWLFSAATFVMCSGLSNSFSYNRSLVIPKPSPIFAIICRAVFITLDAIIISLMCNTESLFEIDILYMMGLITLIYPILRKVPTLGIILFIIFCAVIMPLSRQSPDYMNTWGKGYTKPDYLKTVSKPIIIIPKEVFIWNRTLYGLWRAYLIEGTFPLIANIGFGCLGLVFGNQIVSGTFDSYKILYIVIGVIFEGCGWGIAAWGVKREGLPHSDYISPLCYYPLSISHWFCDIGSCMLLLMLFHFLFDIKKIDNVVIKFFRLAGQSSLTVYTYSYTIIYIIIAIVGRIRKEDVFENCFDFPYPLIIALLIIIFLTILLFVSKKYNGIGTLEHLLVHICMIPKYFIKPKDTEVAIQI